MDRRTRRCKRIGLRGEKETDLGILFAVVILFRFGLLDDPVEKLAPGAELGHQVDKPVVLVHVVQLDDARVVHAAQDLDLKALS